MIQVSVEKPDKNKYTPTVIRKNGKKPSFTGLESLGTWAIKGMQACEAEPMLNVTVLDLSTAIIPRSIIETVAASKQVDENGKPILDENGKQKRRFNVLAGFEALRREGSGLLINCILPGAFVTGAAYLLNKPIMGFKSKLVRNWADSKTLKTLSDFYQGTGSDNYSQMIKRIFLDLKGSDGKTIDKSFEEIYKTSPEEFDQIFENMAKLADSEKLDKNALKAAVNNIIEKTHISENIKFTTNNAKNSYFGDTLESLMKNTVEILHDAQKAGVNTAEEFGKYAQKASKLVKFKSLGGMAVILPLAVSAQPINRWITHKTSGKKGAPIYNDDEERILSKEEKAKLLGQKFISIGSMLGVSWMSMMFKIPNMSMLEFKKFFPSMDLARIVSTFTFASRMGASEDFNDLRESTVRDLATFSSFYFLGDYAAKGIATLIEKLNPDVKLTNELKELDKDANVFKKFWHWTKHTALKSTGELASDNAKNLRSVCQFGNLAFSLISLGIFIPLINRIQTNKNEATKKARLAREASLASAVTGGRTSGLASTGAAAKASSASGKAYEMDVLDKKTTAFGAIFNS